MLHGHVEGLLDHGVLIIDVGTWAHVLLCSGLVVVTLESLLLESLFAGVENHCVLNVLVSRLTEGLWSVDVLVRVLAWAWHVEFQRLAVEHLVIVESGRDVVERNFLASEGLVIFGSVLFGPLLIILQIRDNIFIAYDWVQAREDMIFAMVVGSNSLYSVSFLINHLDSWVIVHVLFESVSG